VSEEAKQYLRDKYAFYQQQPMGQFMVINNMLLLTLAWPVYGGYDGYSCCIKKLP
jgi:hypothetical protein